MKKGEHAVLTISPEYGFGNTEVIRDLAKVPPSSNLLYEVEMLDFVKVVHLLSISPRKRIMQFLSIKCFPFHESR